VRRAQDPLRTGRCCLFPLEDEFEDIFREHRATGSIDEREDEGEDEGEDAVEAKLPFDIGKLGVPDAILTKPGPLTTSEFDVIKAHPSTGAEIVQRLGPLRPASIAILHHHERWDGHGYPAGLSGTSIPVEAAVVGLPTRGTR
jgi:response regulator RpfG family c-di-GMP phosphodiesterase